MRLRRRSVRDQHVRDHEVLDEHHGPQDDPAEIDRTNEGVAQGADACPWGGGQPTAWAGNRRRGTHSNNRFADVEGSTKFKIGQRTAPSTVWLLSPGALQLAGSEPRSMTCTVWIAPLCGARRANQRRVILMADLPQACS